MTTAITFLLLAPIVHLVAAAVTAFCELNSRYPCWEFWRKYYFSPKGLFFIYLPFILLSIMAFIIDK